MPLVPSVVEWIGIAFILVGLTGGAAKMFAELRMKPAKTLESIDAPELVKTVLTLAPTWLLLTLTGMLLIWFGSQMTTRGWLFSATVVG